MPTDKDYGSLRSQGVAVQGSDVVATGASEAKQRQPGDVLDYIPSQHHCREGIAIVRESGRAIDTFWNSGDGHVLTESELATAGLRFRLGDYRKLGESWDDRRDEWLKYAPSDRQIISAQHGLQRVLFVRVDAKPDLATQIENASERVAEAENELRTAEWRVGVRRAELAELSRESRPSRDGSSSHTEPLTAEPSPNPGKEFRHG